MHHSTEMTIEKIANNQETPIEKVSLEESTRYRRRLEQQFQNRKVDEALLRRAWQTAHRLAAMLYEDFGATQVAVFGSLAEQNWFSKGSDIDMAVWGLSGDVYLQAVAETIGFSQEFKIDLVNFESCKGVFRENVMNQAVRIQKDKMSGYTNYQEILVKRKGVNSLNQEKLIQLIQRICDGYAHLKDIVQLIDDALQKIEDAPPQFRCSVEFEIARYLYDFYKQLESIFELIARKVDQTLPEGEKWHKTLLQQMRNPGTARAPVLSQKTHLELQRLLGFRHVFVSIYGSKLDYEQMLLNAKRVNNLFPKISEELDIFVTWLMQQKTADS